MNDQRNQKGSCMQTKVNVDGIQSSVEMEALLETLTLHPGPKGDVLKGGDLSIAHDFLSKAYIDRYSGNSCAKMLGIIARSSRVETLRAMAYNVATAQPDLMCGICSHSGRFSVEEGMGLQKKDRDLWAKVLLPDVVKKLDAELALETKSSLPRCGHEVPRGVDVDRVVQRIRNGL